MEMRPLVRLLGFLSAMALCAVANAQVAPYTSAAVYNNVLSAVALNAGAGTRTITKTLYRGGVQQPAFSKARVSVFFTWAAASTVTVQFSCAIDGVNFAPMTVRTITAGASAVAATPDTFTTGGQSGIFAPEYDVRGCLAARWLLGGAAAGASDLVTVDVALVAGL